MVESTPTISPLSFLYLIVTFLISVHYIFVLHHPYPSDGVTGHPPVPLSVAFIIFLLFDYPQPVRRAAVLVWTCHVCLHRWLPLFLRRCLSFGPSFLPHNPVLVQSLTPTLKYCMFRWVYGVEMIETRLLRSSLPAFPKYPTSSHSPYEMKVSTSPPHIKVPPLYTGEYLPFPRTVIFRRPPHLSRVQGDEISRISPVIEYDQIK